jgi:hypothetical protein
MNGRSASRIALIFGLEARIWRRPLRTTLVGVAVAMALAAAVGVSEAEAMTVEQWRSFDSEGIRVGFIMGVVAAWGDLRQTRDMITVTESTPSERLYVVAAECAVKRPYGQTIAAVKHWMAANPTYLTHDPAMAAVVLFAVLESCGIKGAR